MQWAWMNYGYICLSVEATEGIARLRCEETNPSIKTKLRVASLPITPVYSLLNGCNTIWIESWWRHQMETFSALLAICAGNSPVTALMFSLICVWLNGWVNNREAGDLRRHRAHYDVIVMIYNTIGSILSAGLLIAWCLKKPKTWMFLWCHMSVVPQIIITTVC